MNCSICEMFKGIENGSITPLNTDLIKYYSSSMTFISPQEPIVSSMALIGTQEPKALIIMNSFHQKDIALKQEFNAIHQKFMKRLHEYALEQNIEKYFLTQFINPYRFHENNDHNNHLFLILNKG